MSLEQEGLSLFEAARAMGVSFSQEVKPQDREITLNGLRYHYWTGGLRVSSPSSFYMGHCSKAIAGTSSHCLCA